MATLRFRHSIPVLLASLAAAATAVAQAPAGSPQPMRLPGWIQAIRSQNPDDASPSGTVVTAAGVEDGNPAVAPVADWSAPRPPSPATGRPPIQPTAAPAKPSPPPAAQPATSPLGSFRRWMGDRFASLPKPTEPQAETAKPAGGGGPVGEASTAKGPATVATPDAAAAATIDAPVAVTPDEMPTLSIDPASFRGAHPGKTTRAELETAWGVGEKSAEDPSIATWKIEPFEVVEVTFTDDKVEAISIRLTEQMPVADLARQLEISDLRTVAIRDDAGVEIGAVYPERGVILSVEPGTKQATGILIEPLDPDAFVLRAESELETCSAHAVADLQYALEIDPAHSRALRQLLTISIDQGQWETAQRLAETAARLDPTDVWNQVRLARIMLATDRSADARGLLEAVATRTDVQPLIAAQCARLRGKAALAEPGADHQAAVGHFATAIRLAAPLLTHRNPRIQTGGREILLDAHLGTALAIAEGVWQQKSRVIPKWIVRAETVVKEFKGPEAERRVLELQLCCGALAVAAGSTEAVEPLPWVKRLLELRDTMARDIPDPWRRRQIDWDVGQGLADAIRAAERRGDAADMLDNATLTAAYLERGAEQRELTASQRKQLGDLMFRIGILHSLQRGDHATAVTWFDRTVPLWEGNERFERDGEQGRLGESYVSMAISYWQVERREDALALSRRGVDLMVAAVDAGQLEERALAVAYGNLATMYAEQGDEERSRNYSEMASRAEASAATLR